MAESIRNKVEEHLTCSVCLESFKDPKVLPCLHTFCHVCIVNLAEKAESDTINCPECRLVVKVDENAISTLPSNFFINNLLATMALTKDESVVKNILCDNCDNGDPAQSRCNECGIFLCQFCAESHQRSRSTNAHKLLTLEELKSNAGPQNVAEKIKCPKHKEEVVKLFCKTCQTTICRDCTIVDHQGHKYAFVEDVAVEEKQHFQRNLDEVKQRKVRVEQGIANLEKFNKSLEAKKKSTISEVNKHFDELVRDVECRRRELVEKATSETATKQKQIQGQLEELEVTLASYNSSIEFTEWAFKNGNDVQILSMEKYILQSLEQLKKYQTEPCVAEDMMLYTPPSVHDATVHALLLTEYDVRVDVASPENCTATFIETETPLTLWKPYSITLICKDKENRRLRHGGHVIKPSFTGVEFSDVAVTDNEDGSYIISFALRQGGVLKFEVSIDGVPAPSCSLTRQIYLNNQMFPGGFYPTMPIFPAGQHHPWFSPQVVRPRFSTQAMRGQPNYPGAMMTRPHVQRPALALPVGHNELQTRAGPAGGVPGTGKTKPKKKDKIKHRSPVNQALAGQTAWSNATTSPGIAIPGQDVLNPAVLAQASAADQKEMLGERLFPLIQQTHPDLAGKIIGMLLEIDNAELLHMLEFRDALSAKVDEAVLVLQVHQAREASQEPKK